MTGTGSKFRLGGRAEASVERAGGGPYVDCGSKGGPPGIVLDLSGLGGDGMGVGGFFHVECVSANGDVRWVADARNAVTQAGRHSLLNVYFRAQTQITLWYLGVVANAGFVSFDDADTMSSHANWAEIAGADYSETARPLWTPGAPASSAIVNGSTTNYTMINASEMTVYGLFLTSSATKSGTAGTLFSTAAFIEGPRQVNTGDVLKITYTMSATSVS